MFKPLTATRGALAFLHQHGLWRPAKEWDWRLLCAVLSVGLDDSTQKRVTEAGAKILASAFPEIVNAEDGVVQLAGTPLGRPNLRVYTLARVLSAAAPSRPA